MLEFPLYHGTSTIFLESIKKYGLGGWDPIKEWRVLECARLLLPIAEAHAEHSEVITNHIDTARKMVSQVNDGMNFQHGQVYLSPAELTAVRYATSKKKGSELISRVVLFIEELTRLKVKAVTHDIYNEFPRLVELQDIDSAPILIEVNQVKKDSLLSEKGASPDESIKFIRSAITKFNSRWPMVCQQHNFRLLTPVPANELSVSLISLRSSGFMGMDPDYGLIEVKL
jgi:hypothetical protein